MTETQAGKGVLNWNHPMNAGPIGSNGATSANKLAREADLIISIGTRLSDFTTASKSAFQNPSVRFVGINVTAMDANKLSARAIVADAKRALNALRGELKEAGYAGTQTEYRNEISNLKAAWDAKMTELRTPEEGRTTRGVGSYRIGERDGWWKSNRRLRGGRDAGRTVASLASGRSEGVSHGIWIFVHGL